ncbi:MAG: hypothetical protein CMK32_12430 [Porticoccaceae bacterium]|nr:hypothetical protein [Porticoccaceae bacterium]
MNYRINHAKLFADKTKHNNCIEDFWKGIKIFHYRRAKSIKRLFRYHISIVETGFVLHISSQQRQYDSGFSIVFDLSSKNLTSDVLWYEYVSASQCEPLT